MSKKYNFKVGDKVRLKKEFVGEDGKARIVLHENQKGWTASLNPGFDPIEMTVLSIDDDGDFNENGSPWQAYELVEAAPRKPKKLSGAAKTAHEKKLAREGKVLVEAGENLAAGDPLVMGPDGICFKSELMPPCFPNAPRPEAKVGEKFVLVNIGASLCSYRIGTICQLLSNDSSVMPLFRFTDESQPLFVYWNLLRPLTSAEAASEAAAEAEKDAKKWQPTFEAEFFEAIKPAEVVKAVEVAPEPVPAKEETPDLSIVGFSCRLSGVDFDIDGKATISAQILGDAFAAVPGLREAMLKIIKEA